MSARPGGRRRGDRRAGRRWPPGSFPRDLSRLDSGWLWACDYGLYDARPLNDILAVQAGWPAPYSRQLLDPYFDLAAHMLEIRPVGVNPNTGRLPPKTEFMAEAARRTGDADGFFQPNLAVTFTDRGPEQVNRFGVPQRGCTFVGECDIGCNVGAKNSLDHNYLALAERHGAAVATLTDGKGEEHWFVLEDGGYSRHLARLVAELDVTRLPADLARSIGAGTRRAMAAFCITNDYGEVESLFLVVRLRCCGSSAGSS